MKHFHALSLKFAVAGLLSMCWLAASASVALNATYFPDSTFRAFISTKFDTDKNDTLSDAEIAKVKNITRTVKQLCR